MGCVYSWLLLGAADAWTRCGMAVRGQTPGPITDTPKVDSRASLIVDCHDAGGRGHGYSDHPSSAHMVLALATPPIAAYAILMQDHLQPTGSASAAPYGTQLKVAIPRLSSRRAPPPATPKSRQRDRVQLACRNCHKRSGSSQPHRIAQPQLTRSGQRSNAAAAFPAATIATKRTNPVSTNVLGETALPCKSPRTDGTLTCTC
jgi:hypothetical protein